MTPEISDFESVQGKFLSNSEKNNMSAYLTIAEIPRSPSAAIHLDMHQL